MKKLLHISFLLIALLAVVLFAFSACTSPNTPNEPAAEPAQTESTEDMQTISWFSLTLDLPLDWQVAEISTEEMLLKNGEQQIKFIRSRTVDKKIIVNEINIAGQNYRYFPGEGTETSTLTTSWERRDLIIISTLTLEELAEILVSARKSRLEWEGLEFDRPSGLDWFEDYDLEALVFVEDDGNFLENERMHPCFNEIDERVMACDYQRPLFLQLHSFKLDPLDYPDYLFYDEVDFNGTKYQVLRYNNEFDGTERVLYVGDNSLWIDAEKTYDDEAQDILNETLGL